MQADGLSKSHNVVCWGTRAASVFHHTQFLDSRIWYHNPKKVLDREQLESTIVSARGSLFQS